jgi:ATP-binding cassette subfamily B protein
MLLPALGNTCIYYVAPLIVAKLVGRFASHGLSGIGAAMPYVLGFAGVLFFAEIVWRIGLHGLIRLEGHGIENLYVIGMDELLAKDATFFHDSFAGSLTKRVLSFASRFEDFTDNLVFNIVGNLVPLAFAAVVLWRYDPLLVAGLIGLIGITGTGIAPLIRRRQRLVDARKRSRALPGTLPTA